MRIAIETATKEQLRAFAEMQNLDLPPGRPSEASLRALIERAIPGIEAIDVADEPAAEAPRAPLNVVFSQPANAVDMLDPQKVPAAQKPFLMVELRIQPGTDETAKQPVLVGVDGDDMLIPRGETVSIPYPYYESLHNARGVQWHWQPGEKGLMESSMSATQSYPFQVFRVYEATGADRVKAERRAEKIRLADAAQELAMKQARAREIERAMRF